MRRPANHTPDSHSAPIRCRAVPLTDAELVEVEREIARNIAARAAEPPAVSIEDENRRLEPYNTKLFALQNRVTATPAETLRGCAAKLRVLFDPDMTDQEREFVRTIRAIPRHRWPVLARMMDRMIAGMSAEEAETMATREVAEADAEHAAS